MRVLLIDDEQYWQEKLSTLLQALGQESIIAPTWKAALEVLETTQVDRIVLDLHLGYSRDDGFLLLELLKLRRFHVRTLVLSMSADLQGVAGTCFRYEFVDEVIPKSRFAEFTMPFQRFVRSKGETMKSCSRVFVIHGRNAAARDRVLRVLQDLRTIPVYLEREPTMGRTIIELLETFGDVKYCIAVMSADDVGYCKDEPHLAMPRARQNVVLETGYMMGRLDRARILLVKDSIELPSDLAGIRWVDLASTDDAIKTALVRDFRELGDIQYEL